MRSTRRLFDRSFTGVLAGVYLSVAGGAASCASDRDVLLGSDGGDAAPDVVTADAGSEDAESDRGAPPWRDAATSDAGPRPVVCASSPCAISLTTTPGYDDGFCALLEDGTVACWGQNQHGQLGRGPDAASTNRSIPERVVGLSDVTFLDHTCAVDKDGSTWCWGTGPYLRNPTELMTTELTPVKLPVPPAKMVGLGVDIRSNTAVGCVVTDDVVLCWGTNSYGQVAVPKLDGMNAFLPPEPLAVPAGAPIERLVVGRASFILRADGTLLSWGANPPLGRVSSLVPDPYPGEVALGGVVGIDVVEDTACAVAAGIAHCWGRPIDGNMLAPLERALPRPIPTPEPLVQIATTPYASNTFLTIRWCGVGVSGAVYCWGSNSFGQAGDGTQDYAVEPVAAVGLPGPAAEVKATPRSTCALLTSGKVYCWGGNGFGQLGNGKTGERSLVPQEVMLP